MPDSQADNTSGVSIVGGSCRHCDGNCCNPGKLAALWTTDEFGPLNAWMRRLDHGQGNVVSMESSERNVFFVSCVAD